jgi:transposase-like protein
VLEAYVNGVSTRKVDRLVEQLGIDGITKDRVSALCRALDEQVELFRQRPLEGAYPYLWLDAKVRHEALLVRVGCEAPPSGCRGSPVKLRAA